jgi:NAD(P)-dependent dehydrogenase (short-subunit alcohol dehydrogenase family)
VAYADRERKINMKRVEGKVALITGAGRGVGFGIAQEFIAEGAIAVVADLEREAVDAAVAELGPESSGEVVDVTDYQAMGEMYQRVIDRHGHLDAVVANAGVGDSAPLGQITERQFDFIFGVNAKGVLFTVQAALPLIAPGGTFVLLGSTASVQALYGMSLYGGSKAAIRQFVRGWIQDVKETGTNVRINVLSPGAVDTPSLRIALEGASGADQVQAKIDEMGAGNPLGRLAQPREIGKAAVFLSSDASSYVTGVEMFVDGGLAQTG